MDFNFNLNFSNINEEKLIKKISSDVLYDVIIIGGGPSAMTAAVYCMRKGIKTAIIAEKIGGQVSDTKGIENYMGYKYIEGSELVQKFEEQVKQFEISYKGGSRIEKIENEEDYKKLYTNNNEIYKSKSVIIAAGSKWRELNISGEREFRGRGVSYCTTCDGPFFKNLDVVIAGGGNSGIEAALDLVKIVKSLKIVEFMPNLKADKILIDKIKKYENVEILLNTEIKELKGNETLNEIVIQNRESQEKKSIKAEGLFVEIGLEPNTSFVKGFLELNSKNEIKINENCETSVEGIFAAGDITSVPYKQIIIASGEGAKASMSAANYILKK